MTLLPGVAVVIVLWVAGCGKPAREAAEPTQPKLQDARAYNKRGNDHADKGDWARAIADFTEAIRLRPAFVTYYNRGFAYGKKGDVDSAIADFTEAIRLEPDMAPAYANRGRAYEKKGDRDKANQD